MSAEWYSRAGKTGIHLTLRLTANDVAEIPNSSFQLGLPSRQFGSGVRFTSGHFRHQRLLRLGLGILARASPDPPVHSVPGWPKDCLTPVVVRHVQKDRADQAFLVGERSLFHQRREDRAAAPSVGHKLCTREAPHPSRRLGDGPGDRWLPSRSCRISGDADGHGVPSSMPLRTCLSDPIG